MAVLMLLAVPAPAPAMTGLDVAADLVYQSADELGIGIGLSMQKSPSERYKNAPLMRLGLAIGGASDWRSGTWAGPELSVTFFYVRLGVGRLQRLGQDHPSHTQFGGGFVHPF